MTQDIPVGTVTSSPQSNAARYLCLAASSGARNTPGVLVSAMASAWPCLLGTLTVPGRFVGASYEIQQHARQNITLTQDETFMRRPGLAGMDSVSNDIFVNCWPEACVQ